MTATPPAPPAPEPSDDLDPSETDTQRQAALSRAIEEASALLDRGEVDAARTVLEHARQART